MASGSRVAQHGRQLCPSSRWFTPRHQQWEPLVPSEGDPSHCRLLVVIRSYSLFGPRMLSVEPSCVWETSCVCPRGPQGRGDWLWSMLCGSARAPTS